MTLAHLFMLLLITVMCLLLLLLWCYFFVSVVVVFLSCSIGENVRITDGTLNHYRRGKQLIKLVLVFLFEILIFLYPDLLCSW